MDIMSKEDLKRIDQLGKRKKLNSAEDWEMEQLIFEILTLASQTYRCVASFG